MNDAIVHINDSLWIPREELEFRASRSGGAGGQHVNTSSTRVELLWNVRASPSVTDDQRARIMEKLANRINEDGVLRIAESNRRSQYQNKEGVTERFRELVAKALEVPKPRKRTRPPRAAKEERLREKRRRSEVKRGRGPVGPDE